MLRIRLMIAIVVLLAGGPGSVWAQQGGNENTTPREFRIAQGQTPIQLKNLFIQSTECSDNDQAQFCIIIYTNSGDFGARNGRNAVSAAVPARINARGTYFVALKTGRATDQPLEIPVYLALDAIYESVWIMGGDPRERSIASLKRYIGANYCEVGNTNLREPALSLHPNGSETLFSSDRLLAYTRICRQEDTAAQLRILEQRLEDDGKSLPEVRAHTAAITELSRVTRDRFELLARPKGGNEYDVALVVFGPNSTPQADRVRVCSGIDAVVPLEWRAVASYCEDFQDVLLAELAASEEIDGAGGNQEEVDGADPGLGGTGEGEGRGGALQDGDNPNGQDDGVPPYDGPRLLLTEANDGQTELPLEGPWSVDFIFDPQNGTCFFHASARDYAQDLRASEIDFGGYRVSSCPAEPVKIVLKRDGNLVDRGRTIRITVNPVEGGTQTLPRRLSPVTPQLFSIWDEVYFIPREGSGDPTFNVRDLTVVDDRLGRTQTVSLPSSGEDPTRIVIELPPNMVTLSEVQFILSAEEDAEAFELNAGHCALIGSFPSEPGKDFGIIPLEDPSREDLQLVELENLGNNTFSLAREQTLAVGRGRASEVALTFRPQYPDQCPDFRQDVSFEMLGTGRVVLDPPPPQPIDDLAIFFVAQEMLIDAMFSNQNKGIDFATSLIDLSNDLVENSVGDWSDVRSYVVSGQIQERFSEGQTGNQMINVSPDTLFSSLVDGEGEGYDVSALLSLAEALNEQRSDTTLVMIGFGVDGENLCNRNDVASVQSLTSRSRWRDQEVHLFLFNLEASAPVPSSSEEDETSIKECGTLERYGLPLFFHYGVSYNSFLSRVLNQDDQRRMVEFIRSQRDGGTTQ